MTTTITVNSAHSLHQAQKRIADEWEAHKFLRVNLRTGRDRSLNQNAISHAWYEQISRELGEGTPEDVKAECKLRFGVPILRAEDPEFRDMYDHAIKSRLTYELKLKAMRFLPVTSLMSKNQLSRYLEDMQREYAGRGVRLEFPEGEG